jgi:hypothetical protein
MSHYDEALDHVRIGFSVTGGVLIGLGQSIWSEPDMTITFMGLGFVAIAWVAFLTRAMVPRVLAVCPIRSEEQHNYSQHDW